MSKQALAHTCYRDQIIRAVTGNRPAMVWNVTDSAALARICERLVEAERAAEILLHKGYGKPGMLLHEVVATVPEANELERYIVDRCTAAYAEKGKTDTSLMRGTGYKKP